MERLGTRAAIAGLTTVIVCAAPSVMGAPAGAEAQISGARPTHPAVHPRRGPRGARVSARLTLADAPGHEGVLASAYRLQVDQPPRSRAACSAPSPPLIDSGRQGTRITVALPRPHGGWCVGTYRVSVFLQRGPYCPAPKDGRPPQPCPEFASRELLAGKTRFTVHR